MVARGDVRVGAEAGAGASGRDVMTRGSFVCLSFGMDETFEFGGVSPFRADGEAAA